MQLFPNQITIFSKEGCKYCDDVKAFLIEHNLPFAIEWLQPDLASYADKRKELVEITGHTSFPWIFIGETFLGGYRELIFAFNSLRLHSLVEDIGLKLMM